MRSEKIKILIQLLVLSAFILIGCQKKSHHNTDYSIPPRYVAAEPKFTKQGNLTFLNKSKQPVSTIDIEIAETPQACEKGLMNRKSMEPQQGMLFIFEDESRRTFWMKDTDLPLDIIFVNSEKMVIHIAPDCVPYSTESIPSFEYAQYVVEVNAGYCKKFSITDGCYIDFQRK